MSLAVLPAVPVALRAALPDCVSAVVFDCDGLLVDSEGAYRRAEAVMFAERGVPYLPEHRAALTGRTIDDIGRMLADWFGPGESPALLVGELLTRVETDGRSALEPIPGAVELVQALSSRVPVGLASNAARWHVEQALDVLGLRRAFSAVVTADDVRRPKPHPEPYRAALARLGVEDGPFVVFEDSRTGATAARRAGAFVVAVPSTPGTAIPHDLVVSSLRDGTVRSWAGSVRRTEPPVARFRPRVRSRPAR